MGQNTLMEQTVEKRKNSRFQSFAKVIIKEFGKEEFQLKDLSITGCRIEYPLDVEILLDMRFSLKIIPEKEAKIHPFSIIGEARWIRVSSTSCEAGFLVTDSPKGKQFKNYVDYLSWRYSQGKSMINEDISDPSIISKD